MKKLRVVVCVLLAMILLLGILPVVSADDTLLPNVTLTDRPQYAHSFLLSIDSQSKQEYTLADFPNIEHLYLVKTVKMTETETGYCYLLLMAIDNYNLDQAKQQASACGSVSVNYFASDYIAATSYMQLNYTSLEMKVGETIELRPAVRDLTPIRYALSGVMFTVDPTVIDEAALVESEYQNMGLRTTIGAEDISMISWQYNMGVIWNGPYSPQNTISPIHTYYGLTYSNNILDVAHNLANQEGVESVCLVYEHAMYTAEAAYVRYSCDLEGIVAMDNNYNAYGNFRIAITAVQPGEVTITAKAGGGGLGSATATCKITVVEDTPDIPQTPTDPPADIPYGDVNGDKKVNAEDALTVLKYVVRKIDLTEAQKLAAEVDGNDSISASDALEILKFTVNKITNFPIESVSADVCLLS